MTKMNWNNLASMKCPRCSGILGDSGKRRIGEKHYVCGGCHFGIWENRLAEVIAKPKVRSYHIPTEEENELALNNLGYEERSFGFIEESDMSDII